MKKIYWVLLFIVLFFVVFAVSAVSTFMFALNRGDNDVEDATEAVYTGGAILPQGNTIEAETTVTRVTPTLTVADAIIVRGIYGANDDVYEKPSIDYSAFEEDDEDLAEDAAVGEGEAVRDEVAAEEAPKAEEKKEEVKIEEKKVEEKAPEVKAEDKKEEVKVEAKAEEPKVEEAPKAEEPKVEEKPVVLDPNKQYSDTGI